MGIHILLEECELLFEVYTVNLLAGEQNYTEYLAINPKATIPALVREDGTSLTDFQAIAWWLAHTYPKARLLPDKLDEQIKVLDIMNYSINTIHMQGFARLFTTDKFTPSKSDHEWVKQQGYDIVNKGFAVVDTMLSAQEYVNGTFSIADAALFYVEFWADKMNITLPDNCMRHYQAMLKRPTVRQVLAEEGYPI
jgi:glutathione S-transferase